MSARPIPPRLRAEFLGALLDTYSDGDLPDGAWFAMLEEEATRFMREHRLRGDSNDAVHQGLNWFADEAGKP